MNNKSFEFYVFLNNNQFDNITNKNKNLIHIGKMKYSDDINLYKINSIDSYFNSLTNINKESCIVTDFTNTLRIKVDGEIMINKYVSNFLENYINKGNDLFICSWLSEDVLLDWGSNDLKLYLEFQNNNKKFPDNINYIFCTGDKIAKRYFIYALEHLYQKVEFLIDDSIFNLVKYYDPRIDINKNSNIPQYILYNIKGKSRSSINSDINRIIFRDQNQKINSEHKQLVLKNLKIVPKEIVIEKYGGDYYKKLYDIYKKKYKRIKNKSGGNNDYHNYNKSAVLLFEKGDDEIKLILMYSPRYETYTTMGGKIDKKEIASKDILKTTLIREIIEESSNLLDISLAIKNYEIPFFDVVDDKTKKKTRVFCIVLGKGVFDTNILKENRKILDKHKLPFEWTERTYSKKILLDDLIRCIDFGEKLKHNTFCATKDKEKKENVKIYNPVIKYLDFARKHNVFQKDIFNNPIIKFEIIKNKTNDFLNNTQTIKLL